ncbi:uncharacterized protein LOC143234625 isoform X2 [Tachypleus tridentatus]|uniref:uncharacterized protein LOC143234625 isoform X2 n=1 Tax=Tachypleus tridentatus TaxID=6853 RepID=UPI003FD2DD0E
MREHVRTTNDHHEFTSSLGFNYDVIPYSENEVNWDQKVGEIISRSPGNRVLESQRYTTRDIRNKQQPNYDPGWRFIGLGKRATAGKPPYYTMGLGKRTSIDGSHQQMEHFNRGATILT